MRNRLLKCGAAAVGASHHHAIPSVRTCARSIADACAVIRERGADTSSAGLRQSTSVWFRFRLPFFSSIDINQNIFRIRTRTVFINDRISHTMYTIGNGIYWEAGLFLSPSRRGATELIIKHCFLAAHIVWSGRTFRPMVGLKKLAPWGEV